MRIDFAFAVWAAFGLSVAAAAELPPPAENGPAALEATLPQLACQALAPGAEPVMDLDRRFHLEMACGEYAQALESLAQWNRRNPPPAGQTVEPMLRLELHALAKVQASRDGISYEQAFISVLARKFERFSDREAVDSAWTIALPVFAARGNLDRQLQRLAGKERLTPAERHDLAFWYDTWRAVDSYAAALDAAIAADDARRFIIDRGALIRTPTGATISADIVRPRRLSGPQPTALRFTIYSDPVFNLKSAKEAAARGYVGVLASARGKNLSTDRIVPWETEVEDTHAVIDWIARQPWSDGQVGMFGNSYEAFAQWAAAKNPPHALKTIVPSGATEPGNGLPMQNNVFLLANYGWPLQVSSDRYMGDRAFHDWNRWSALTGKWFESGKAFRTVDALDGTPNEILQRQLLHPSFDAYWEAMQPRGKEFAKIGIPVLSITGYFDDARLSAVSYLQEHNRYNPKAEHYLVIGPWCHLCNISARKDPAINGYTIDPVANIDTESLVFQWFDHVLRGGPKPSLLADRINYQVMGANTWSHSPSVGKMADRSQRLYLTSEPDGKRHALLPGKPRKDQSIEQTIDLADRKSFNNLYPVSAYLDSPDDPTHLAYISQPFDHALCVCGLITGEMIVTIDRKDFDFSWSLYEATPDGKYINLSYYLGRASFAGHPEKRVLLTPGKPAALRFANTPLVARQMALGSRLLLLVTANKNPNAQVNYGTGMDVSDETIADAGRPLTVRWSGASYIDVPLRAAARN